MRAWRDAEWKGPKRGMTGGEEEQQIPRVLGMTGWERAIESQSAHPCKKRKDGAPA